MIHILNWVEFSKINLINLIGESNVESRVKLDIYINIFFVKICNMANNLK